MICNCGHLRDHHHAGRDHGDPRGRCVVESCDCPVFRDSLAVGTPVAEPGTRELTAMMGTTMLWANGGTPFHDGEPVFVIRAQDLLAPQAIAAYARLARTAGLDDFAREVESRAVEVLQWQSTHAKLVKRPD